MAGEKHLYTNIYMYMISTKEFRCGAINPIRSLKTMKIEKKTNKHTHTHLWNKLHAHKAQNITEGEKNIL